MMENLGGTVRSRHGWAQCYPKTQSPIISKALVEGRVDPCRKRVQVAKEVARRASAKTEKWPLAERERPAWQSPRSSWKPREWGGKGVEPP